MPTFVMGITAAPRSTSYLEQTLSTLEGQISADAVHIFAEPQTIVPLDRRHWLHMRKTRHGNWHNWLSMCRWFLANSAADYIFTVEDDVIFAPGAIAEALEIAPTLEKMGLLSLYTSGKYQRSWAVVRDDVVLKTTTRPGIAKAFARRKRATVEEKRLPDGVHGLTVKSLWGACAWMFHRDRLAAILANPRIESWRGTNACWPKDDPTRIDGVDIVVGRALADLQLITYFMQPSRVQHIGEVSALANGELTDIRRALDFSGK